MSDLILAGIINLKTGEITDTTTIRKEKTSIRLKVRDELGCKHGRGDFMAFEFGVSSNIDYCCNKMINKCPNALLDLKILHTKYRISESKRYIETAKLELDLAESVSYDCANLYQSEKDSKKLDFINQLTEDGVNEAQENLNDVKSILNNKLRSLKKLEDDKILYETEKKSEINS
jgi:hypothetical protein